MLVLCSPVPTGQGSVTRVGINARNVRIVTRDSVTTPVIVAVDRGNSWNWGGSIDNEIDLQSAIDHVVTGLDVHCPTGGCNIVTCGAMP